MRRNKNSNKTNTKGKSTPKAASKSTNDPAWYASDPAILRDAASIPFSWSLGTTIPRGGEGEFSFPNSHAIPGIMRMDLMPTMGLSVTGDSALNTAATAMYSYVRHANSGHANYDAADLMLYCGAMAQVYSYINWCQRLYGTLTMYAQKNRYIPQTLIASMDVDYDDLASHIADFRYWLNVMIAKASSMAVPATMSYFSRTAFLYSNIYCESESIKDQLYYYHPAAWLMFQLEEGVGAGMLKSVPFTASASNGLLSYYDIRAFGDMLLSVILPDEDFNIMSGDILKAYGVDGIIKLSSVPEYYPLYPVYDKMVLEQMHNATVVDIYPVDITQNPDTGILQSTPSVGDDPAGILSCTMNKVITYDDVEVTPDVVMEITRLTLGSDSSRSTETDWLIGCGTEIPVAFHLYLITDQGTLSDVEFQSVIPSDSAGASINSLGRIHSFKYVPSVFVANNNGGIIGRFESIDNYAVLNFTDVYKLHDVALMNMLAVPSVARVVKP